MAPESTSNKRICIIGGGPAGCICAYFLQNEFNVSIFDGSKILKTLLPTGGGRCNLAHAEYDFKTLTKNYPRGEKFLYSIFSKFSTSDTLEFFNNIGVKTYTQDDNRIFPVSDSAVDVRNKFLKAISNCHLIHEEVQEIAQLENCFKIKTEKSSYAFDIVVIAIGGHSKWNILKNLDINIIEPTQALVGLETAEDYSSISGVSLKNVSIQIDKQKYSGDILFTHKGISGPLIYTISSVNARKELPYKLNLNIFALDNLQEHLNNNPHKEIKNLLGQFVPKSFAEHILRKLNIPIETPCHKLNGKMRDLIISILLNFEIIVTGKVRDGEVVTCGGINLKEVNPQTLESKKIPGIYFCGEVLDIDGFCGGFNLQNCWSTGYVAAQGILDNTY